MDKEQINDTCVYLHHKASNSEVFYVGIGDEDRPYETKSRNEHWHNIFKKHNIIINICETNMSWSEACDKEINLIKLIGRKDKGLGTLCNWTDGGDGSKGRVMSNKTKEKIRIKALGRIPSIETRFKLGDGIPILQYSLDGKFIKEWRFAGECVKYGFTKVRSAFKAKSKIYKGFLWIKKLKNNIDLQIDSYIRHKSVNKIYTYGQ